VKRIILQIFFLSVVVALVINQVQAQIPSYLGRFEAEYDQGCEPLKVILTETDTFPDATVIQYDFTNSGVFIGFEDGEEITHTYTTPGNYTIVQLTGIDIPGVSKLDTLDIEVYASSDPYFEVFTCENNGAKIDIYPDQYDQYKIFFTATDSLVVDKNEEVPSFIYPSGSHSITVEGLFIGGEENCGFSSETFTTIENLLPADIDRVNLSVRDSQYGIVDIECQLQPNVIYELQIAANIPAGFSAVGYLDNNLSSFKVDSIDTDTQLQIFRIAAYDACQDKHLYSDTISTVLMSAIPENNQNRIGWNVYPIDFNNYKLYKDTQLFQQFQNEGFKEYIDKEVECFNTYCYSIQYTHNSGALSISDTVCVDAFKIYFPPSIKNTSVSIEGNTAELAWDAPGNVEVSSYFIQRQVDDDIFATLDTVLVREYTDVDIEPAEQSFCYIVNYLDECRNRSNLGDLACTIYLTIEDNRLLIWNDYSGWRNGVKQYIVEVYDENGNFQNEVNVGRDNLFEDIENANQQIRQYRIRGESNDDPSLIVFSNYIIKVAESILIMPNSFTPDGDGLNDYFKPEGTEMDQYNLKIFTRYGNIIFETDDQNIGWDGTYNGDEMPPTTFIYIIEAVDVLGKKYNMNGQVLIVRD